jgi:hypothetical protein
MTSRWFLGFVLLVAGSLIVVATRHLPRRQAIGMTAALSGWLIYVGTLSWTGVIADPSLRPPGIVYLVGPVVVFMLLGVARSAWAGGIASAVPLWTLIGFQTYRVGVELFLHELWVERLVPKMLTFEGANVDILIGASAAAVAWVATRGRSGLRVALAWNVVGLLALGNVVARSALTSPGPLNFLKVETLNRAIGTFPYTYIAGFLAPLAVVLHVLSLRSIIRRLRTEVGPTASPIEPMTLRADR